MNKNPMAKSAVIPNIGPKTMKWLHEIGVRSYADLESLGSVEVYVRLKQARPAQVSLNALWALEAAIRNIHWQRLPDGIKDRLRAEVKNILGA